MVTNLRMTNLHLINRLIERISQFSVFCLLKNKTATKTAKLAFTNSNELFR